MTTKTKRTGASLRCTPNDVPTATMLTLGLSRTQAERIIAVRRVLPYTEDDTSPSIDARKLWERIGRPHNRFNDWAAHYIKPEMANAGQETFTGISVKAAASAGGRPRTDYTVSRRLAAHLAMQANTPEGRGIRDYFLDMERLAVRLSEHLGVRVDAIVTTDNRVTHDFTKRAAEQAKAGQGAKSEVRAVALEREKRLKSVVCDVVTGRSPQWWRDTFKRGVRDVLHGNDLATYASAYESARAFIAAGIHTTEALRRALKAAYSHALVNPERYLKAHREADLKVA